jgi:hypothetical protein
MAAMPATTALVFTCDPCAAEYFPQGIAKLSEIGIDYPDDPHGAIVHAPCAADFVANGFELIPDFVEGTNDIGLFCPHLQYDEDVQERLS